ncbi:hypothetical protein L6258_03330, partial [Candidatus Parcubacteria bacterium]|nr:hypothetical protein [Candidatus Parcubacteria bacterium]
DVPFVWLDSQENMEEVLLQEEKRYFAYLPAEHYGALRGKLGRREMGSRVVIASGDLLLIEKW